MMKPQISPLIEEQEAPFTWPEGGLTRVPYRVFSDPEIFALEQERIFRGPTWNFLSLEVEIPNPGDFKTTHVGEMPVIVVRDRNGAINAMVNRCAHKGSLVCLERRGNRKALTCVYHSWSYNLKGDLTGVAFRNGINQKGGMPKDFDLAAHGLEKLRVNTFCGLVFGTFREETEPIEDYLGEKMRANITRLLSKPVRILGTHSQLLNNNWKMYAENLRDAYHATLLHLFYTTFKINRLDMVGGIVLDDTGRHAISYSKQATFTKEAPEYREKEIHSVRSDAKLAGPELLETWPEFENGVTHAIQSIFPTLGIQMTLNSLAIRSFFPRGIHQSELSWTYLGYEDDDEEKTRIRIRQSNLTGASGYVSLEDGCIGGFVERGIVGDTDGEAVLEMGGSEVASLEGCRATETSVRGFWKEYCHLMGF